MADDRSKQGYEDMLASVRRIVASEGSSAHEADAGKLLLTPALRVAGPEDEADAAPSSKRDFPTLAERIAELEAAVGNTPAEWEPDGSEDQAQHAPDAVVLPLNLSARRHAALSRSNDTNEADIVFAVPGEPAADEQDAATADDDVAPSDVSEERDAPVGEHAATDRSDAPVANSEPPLATFRHRGVSDAPREQPAEDDEPLFLEEAALRELVSEIVREELQGGLGERITRNVRKLVRAEIQRAFAARDLD